MAVQISPSLFAEFPIAAYAMVLLAPAVMVVSVVTPVNWMIMSSPSPDALPAKYT